MKKDNKMIIFSLALVISVFVIFIFLLDPKDTDQKTLNPKKNEGVTNEEKLPPKIEKVDDMKKMTTLEKHVRYDIALNKRGSLYEGFALNENHYVILSQSNTTTYTNDYPSDFVLWTVIDEKTNEITYKDLGTYHVSQMFKDKKGDPFIKQQERLFISFHERSTARKNGYPLKGYIYEIEQNGQIKKAYETDGVYHDSYIDKNNRFILLEKEYDDDINKYPYFLKPYKLKKVFLQNGDWVVKEIDYVVPKLKK